MSRSRDTIFQSLGLEGVKFRSGLETLKSRKTSVSRGCFYKFASKFNEVTKENNLRKTAFINAVFHKLFKKHISVCKFRSVIRCILVARKENLTGFLTGRSKNLDPTGALPVPISAPDLPLRQRYLNH